MKPKTNKLVNATLAGVVAAGLALASTSSLAAADNMEKCYGVAKVGKNDCGGKGTGHTCQGQSKKAGDSNDWLIVPHGLCDKLVGGTTTPAWKKSDNGDKAANKDAA